MTREEFIKQRCEIDKITEEEFKKRYRVVKCNCGQPYCKGYRCLDLDGLLKENQSLKKQLEEYEATNEVLSHELTKDKLLQQDCLTTCCGIPVGDIPKFIDKYNKLENNWNKLKKWMQKELVDSKAISGYSFYLKSWLDKIQEIEGGMNE